MPVKFTTTAADEAPISRGHVVYATGEVLDAGRARAQLMLVPLRTLWPGKYTLTYRTRIGERTVDRRMRIMIR